MRIHSLIDILDDGKHDKRKDAWDNTLVIVHRIWFNDWNADRRYSVQEMMERFLKPMDLGKATGNNIPYTYVIDRDGTVFQCLPMDEVGKHARAWNIRGVAIACVGDFRKEKMPAVQREALVELSADLCGAFGNDANDELEHSIRPYGHIVVKALSGHSELPGGSGDKSKICPAISMDALRDDVDACVTERARRRITLAGHVLT